MSDIIDFRVRLPADFRPVRVVPDHVTARYDVVLDLSEKEKQTLDDLQRSLATREGTAGTVAEGRDIGTVVFPDATVKFFLTASLEIRARRRQDELAGKGVTQDFETTKLEVERRDKQDSEREIAPLRQADDALLVDSSDRSIDDVVGEMLAAVERKRSP